MGPITTQDQVNLIKHLEATLILVVREFYVNVVEHQDHNVFIRRKLVSFDSSKINAFYGAPNINEMLFVNEKLIGTLF